MDNAGHQHPEGALPRDHRHRARAAESQSVDGHSRVRSRRSASPIAWSLRVPARGSSELPARQRIDALAEAYLKAVKAKQAADVEGRRLYDALLQPISEAKQKENLVVVPDGRLHLVPFDALVDSGGKYVVESHSVTYAPSATGFFLLNDAGTKPPRRFRIPFSQSAEFRMPAAN